MGILDLIPWRSKQPALLPALDDERAQRMLSRAFDADGAGFVAATMMRSNAKPRKGAAEILNMYRDSPWLRAVSHKVSSSVASVPWKLYAQPMADERGGRTFVRPDLRFLATEAGIEDGRRHALIKRAVAVGELVEIQRHPFHVLMRQPNPLQTGRVARQVTVASRMLIGDAAWILDDDGKGGPPLRAWPIPGTWINERPTADRPWWTVNIGTASWPVPLDSLLIFNDPDPSNPYSTGAGLGLALADELDIDEHAAKTTAAWFQNRAMPDAIVAMEGAKREELDRAKKTWTNLLQGFRKSWKTHFTNTKINIQRLDTSFKEQQLVELRKAERDTIQQVTGIPPEKLGILTSSNKATAFAADGMFAADTLVPHLEVLREQFQRLAVMWDQRLIVDYENPIPADKEAKRAAMVAFPGRFTIDEERAVADLPPLPDAVGEGFLVPANLLYLKSLAELPSTPPAVPSFGAPALPPSTPTPALPPHEESEPELDASPQPKPVDDDDDRATRAVPKQHLTQEEIVRVLRGIDKRSMFDALAPVVRALVVESGQDALDTVVEAVEPSRAAARASGETDALRATLEEDALALLADGFDDDSTAVRKHMRELGSKRVQRMINETTKSELDDALRAAIRVDDPTPESILEAAQSVFERARESRADGIANTEAAHHGNFGAIEGLRQSGIRQRKEWIATMDGRARDAHEQLDGQLRELDEMFEVPAGEFAGAQAMMPGGFVEPALSINCRCALGTRIDELNDETAAKLQTRGLLVNVGPSADVRAAAWRAFDERLKPWDGRLRKAVRDGFDAQEINVLAALEEALGN